jgi:hypothetical protein
MLTALRTETLDDRHLPARAIQALLEEARADALLFYDCCYAAESTVCIQKEASGERSVTDLISSSGFEHSSFTGSDSFTETLCECLKTAAISGQPFAVSDLHREILSTHKVSQDDEISTPILCNLTSAEDHRPILLWPLTAEAKEIGPNAFIDLGFENISEPTCQVKLNIEFKGGSRVDMNVFRDVLCKFSASVRDIKFSTED